MQTQQKQSGQSLVEVIIALGVLMVVVVGFTNLILTALQNAQYARSQEEANQHARNTIEIIRVIRDQGTPITTSGAPISWAQIWNGSDSYSMTRPNGNCYTLNDTFPTYSITESTRNCPATSQYTNIGTSRFRREIRFMDGTDGTTGSSRSYFTIRVRIEWYDAKGPHTAEVTTSLARIL